GVAMLRWEHAGDPRMAARVAAVAGGRGEPVRSASGHVPAARSDGAPRTRGDAWPVDAARTGVERVGGARRLDREGKQERGAQSHPGTELRVYEDAEQAAASEPGALGQVHERQRERLVPPGGGGPRWAAEIEAGRTGARPHER